MHKLVNLGRYGSSHSSLLSNQSQSTVKIVSGRAFTDLEVIRAKQLSFENTVDFQSKAKDLNIRIYCLAKLFT